MIHIIITSYNEPIATLRAVNSILNQDFNGEFEIIVVDPFPETEKFLLDNLKDKRVKFFLDPGEGKSYALNLLFQEYSSGNKEDLFIMTDGDVYISENSLSEISNAFKNPQIGCVTAKPVVVDNRSNKYGFWAHLAFSGIDKARKKLSDQKRFFECSGYLFAIRKAVILDFPIDACEDSIIPYLFWKKGYGIKYLPQINVYVKNPENIQDYFNQKIRNIKGHENLKKIAPGIPRTKSLLNEIAYGWHYLFIFPRTIKEFYWAIQLYFLRLYIWIKSFHELKNARNYSDGWREVETPSTKPFD